MSEISVYRLWRGDVPSLSAKSFGARTLERVVFNSGRRCGEVQASEPQTLPNPVRPDREASRQTDWRGFPRPSVDPSTSRARYCDFTNSSLARGSLRESSLNRRHCSLLLLSVFLFLLAATCQLASFPHPFVTTAVNALNESKDAHGKKERRRTPDETLLQENLEHIGYPDCIVSFGRYRVLYLEHHDLCNTALASALVCVPAMPDKYRDLSVIVRGFGAYIRVE